MLTIKERKELCTAVEKGNIDTIEQAINKKKFDINGVINTEHEYTALHIAAANGQVQMVEFLIAQGADLDPIDKYKDTALEKAICHLGFPENNKFNQHRDIIEILLRKGAKTTFTTRDHKEVSLHLLADKQVQYIVYEIFCRLGKISVVDSAEKKENLEKQQDKIQTQSFKTFLQAKKTPIFSLW